MANNTCKRGRTRNWCLKVRIPDYLSLRTSAHTGVAIPRLEGKCTEKYPEEWDSPAIFGGNRYRVPWDWGIATTSLRTGLAMTGNLESDRQTPICRANYLRFAIRKAHGHALLERAVCFVIRFTDVSMRCGRRAPGWGKSPAVLPAYPRSAPAWKGCCRPHSCRWGPPPPGRGRCY